MHGRTDRKVHAATCSAFTAWSFPQFAHASRVLANILLRTCDVAHTADDGFRTNDAGVHRKLHDRGIEKIFPHGLIGANTSQVDSVVVEAS